MAGASRTLALTYSTFIKTSYNAGSLCLTVTVKTENATIFYITVWWGFFVAQNIKRTPGGLNPSVQQCRVSINIPSLSSV